MDHSTASAHSSNPNQCTAPQPISFRISIRPLNRSYLRSKSQTRALKCLQRVSESQPQHFSTCRGFPSLNSTTPVASFRFGISTRPLQCPPAISTIQTPALEWLPAVSIIQTHALEWLPAVSKSQTHAIECRHRVSRRELPTRWGNKSTTASVLG